MAYAQAAALAAPEHAPFALLTGRFAEELGQHPRAVTWYQRTVALARRERDPVTYSAAFLALARQADAAQEPGRARRFALRALRSARRAGTAGQEYTRAAYLLFRLARTAGAEEASHRYARLSTGHALRGTELDPASLLNLAEHWYAHGRGDLTRRLLELLTPCAGLPPLQALAPARGRRRRSSASRTSRLRGATHGRGPGMEAETMKSRGRKKRSRRRLRGVAARRAEAQRTLGGLLLGLVIEQGLLAPSTGREAGPRVRASAVERAYFATLHELTD